MEEFADCGEGWYHRHFPRPTPTIRVRDLTVADLWTVAKRAPTWFFVSCLMFGLPAGVVALIARLSPSGPRSGGDGDFISGIWHVLPIPVRVLLFVAPPFLLPKAAITVLRWASMSIEEMAWAYSGASLAARIAMFVHLFLTITLFFYWWPAGAVFFAVTVSVVGSLAHCISEKEETLAKKAWAE